MESSQFLMRKAQIFTSNTPENTNNVTSKPQQILYITLVSCIIVKTLHFQRKSMYNFEELNIVNKFYFKLQFFHSQKDTLFPQVADKDFFAYVRSALYLLCVISTPLQCANTLGAFISKASLVTWHNGTSLKTKWSAHLMNPETEKTQRHLQ